MSNLTNLNLDPNVEENNGFFIVPAGRYEAVIIKDELKDNKNKNGKYLELTLQITSGDFIGNELIDRINLINPNEICQKIGQGTLKKICTICNIQYPPENTQKLYGKPLIIIVIVDEYEHNEGIRKTTNKIKSYSQKTKIQNHNGSW